MIQLKIQLAGQLEIQGIREVKKSIAQIKTILREKAQEFQQ
ncbi:MAG: 50S ribosomal protein L29 [Clostridioides difficile]